MAALPDRHPLASARTPPARILRFADAPRQPDARCWTV